FPEDYNKKPITPEAMMEACNAAAKELNVQMHLSEQEMAPQTFTILGKPVTVKGFEVQLPSGIDGNTHNQILSAILNNLQTQNCIIRYGVRQNPGAPLRFYPTNPPAGKQSVTPEALMNACREARNIKPIVEDVHISYAQEQPDFKGRSHDTNV